MSQATDRVVMEMDISEEHRVPSGAVHPAVAFSLADCAMSLASNARVTAVAIATHLSVGAGGSGEATLTAEATVSSRRGRVVTWRAQVTAGEAMVASFTGTTLQTSPLVS